MELVTMKRRIFNLLAGSSMAALKFGYGEAQAASPNASLLTTTLTPVGAERAGNADGSIPAWTGGLTTLPPGLAPDDYIPELFPDEKPVLVINASNMTQHADRLSEGTMAMMTKYGFSIHVYPTHRTAAAPQFVYDNIAQNVTRASLLPQGGRFGLTGAYGGVPFPIPDTSDVFVAGVQIIWNHLSRWESYGCRYDGECWLVSNGQLTLSGKAHILARYDYYAPQGNPVANNGRLWSESVQYFAPASLIGQSFIVYNNLQSPNMTWLLEVGQARVRRAPEENFDTPSSNANGIINYDEYNGFDGLPVEYDWKLIGKEEIYIPYNNNAIYGGPAETAHGPHFIDPDLVRWELHRCWVVEATLHPGERNVLSRRRFYIDEDTWTIGASDSWDANNNLYKVGILYNYCRPDLPGTIYGNFVDHNLQTGDYVSVLGPWNQGKKVTYKFVDNIPDSAFDPTQMAASNQY